MVTYGELIQIGILIIEVCHFIYDMIKDQRK